MSNPQSAAAVLLAGFVFMCAFVAWAMSGDEAGRKADEIVGVVLGVGFLAVPCFLLAVIFGLVP